MRRSLQAPRPAARAGPSGFVSAGLLIGACAALLMPACAGRGDRVPPVATSSGLLDHFAADPEHDRLERLALKERYAEAFSDAVALLGARARALGPTHPSTLASLQWTAAIASLGGDERTASDLFDSLVAIRRLGLAPDDPALADALLRRGRVARLLEEPEAARRDYAETRRILEARGGPVALLAALEQSEAGLLLRSDPTGAARAYDEALRLRRRDPRSPRYPIASLEAWLAWSLDRLGSPEEAAPHLDAARREIRALGLSGGTLDATVEQLQADQLAFRGRFGQAEVLYRAVAAADDAARMRHLGGFARRICPPDGYEEQALMAIRRGDGDRAWELLERGRAAMHRDLLALRSFERHDPDAGAEMAALRRTLLDARRAVDAARRGGERAWAASTWALTLRALEGRAREAILEERALEAMGPWTPSVAATQALLDRRTAVLGYLQLNVGGAPSVASEPRRSWGYLYVLRDTGPVRWVPLWDERTTPDDLTPRGDWGPVFVRVKRAAEWPLRVDPDPLVIEQLREFARHYLDPALPYLDGVERLVVEGTRVPLEPARLPDGRFAADRFAVTYAPSAGILPLLRDRPRRARSVPRSILALTPSADRLTGGDLVAQALGDEHRDLRRARTSFERGRTRLERLPHLPFAGLEADAAARHFPRAAVLHGGPDAEGRLRAVVSGPGLETFDVLHVATHTLTDAAQERCGLALSEREPPPGSADDGVLDAEEVLLGWRLDGALLTLSACESARAAGTSRGEELGLTPALFAAGADRVLVSLWTVDDRATAVLMDRFYEDLTGVASQAAAPDGTGPAAWTPTSRAPLGPAASLREAKAYLRGLTDSAGRHPFEHPAYWAGFILMGLPD